MLAFAELAQEAVDELFRDGKIPRRLKVRAVVQVPDLLHSYRIHFESNFITLTWGGKEAGYTDAVKVAVLKQIKWS
jgi:hypothetical protein